MDMQKTVKEALGIVNQAEVSAEFEKLCVINAKAKEYLKLDKYRKERIREIDEIIAEARLLEKAKIEEIKNSNRNQAIKDELTRLAHAECESRIAALRLEAKQLFPQWEEGVVANIEKNLKRCVKATFKGIGRLLRAPIQGIMEGASELKREAIGTNINDGLHKSLLD